ncbi:tetratricopeptide repeat protein [Fructilactobacillus sp. Tb1]|uniref:tetratricopeptide repeat protein n=1 Tax=Fructilactobacillus sp. Tb1 TaxID=3422304 RepID=UPI003D2D9C02
MNNDEKQRQAEATLHKLVKDIDDHPHDYRTYYDLSVFLIQLKSYTQAEELLMKAMELFKGQSKKITNTLTYGLGNVYYSAGEFEKAIQQFQQVTDKDLQSDAYVMLAQSYMSQKNYKKALVFLLTAQETAKQDPSINLLIGQCLMSLGNFQQAADYYDKILENDKTNGEANFNRGLIAMVLGENFEPYFKAAEKYDKAYFDKEQGKISDIEKFIQIRKGKK